MIVMQPYGTTGNVTVTILGLATMCTYPLESECACIHVYGVLFPKALVGVLLAGYVYKPHQTSTCRRWPGVVAYVIFTGRSEETYQHFYSAARLDSLSHNNVWPGSSSLDVQFLSITKDIHFWNIDTESCDLYR